MKIKEYSYSLMQWATDPVILTGLFAACYVAVLPMAGTIALRNVVFSALLLCLAWNFKVVRQHLSFGLPLLVWTAYLVVFPVIVSDHTIAWQSLEGQWGRGLLAMLAGAGVAAVLANPRAPMSFYIGALSAVPILIHLILFAWKGWETASIPWGYWGRETHHADLGYAAGQMVVLMTATVVAGDKKYRWWAIMLIIAALLSTALARSRAGMAFAILGGILVLLVAYFAQGAQKRRQVFIWLTALVLVGVAIAMVAIKDDPRWRNMTSQLSAGFLGNAIQIECEGTSSIESRIIDQYGSGERAQQVISSVRDGDGARMVVLRAGLVLALKYPWGIDGSRQSFQKLLRQECATPAIQMAHTHNGWLDTILALGWLGGLFYFWVMIYFLRSGFHYLRNGDRGNEWAIILVALALFWIIRGFTDSVFRDHMLEMQGFVLSFGATLLKKQLRS